MSQHQIHIESPKVGRVLVTVGYDAVLSEAFMNFYNDDAGFMSPPGTQVSDLQAMARDQLGVELPRSVIDGVDNDVADLRLGATDIGRRVVRYESDGQLAREPEAQES